MPGSGKSGKFIQRYVSDVMEKSRYGASGMKRERKTPEFIRGEDVKRWERNPHEFIRGEDANDMTRKMRIDPGLDIAT